MVDYAENPNEGIFLSEYIDLSFVDGYSDFSASAILSKQTYYDIDFKWNISTINVDSDFSAFLTTYKTSYNDFSATVCFKKSTQAGSVGSLLAGEPGSPIGFFPHCSVSGYKITSRIRPYVWLYPSGTVPESLSWEVWAGDGLSIGRGKIDWARIYISYLNSSYSDPSGIYEYLILPGSESGVWGTYNKTKIINGGTTDPDKFDRYLGEFTNIPSGEYEFVVELKQSCNPHPVVLTKHFVVGTSGVYDIAVSGVPTSGTYPVTATFSTDRIDLNSESTKEIHWDIGNISIDGGNASEIKNFSMELPRVGMYIPICTHVLENGYIISKTSEKIWNLDGDNSDYTILDF